MLPKKASLCLQTSRFNSLNGSPVLCLGHFNILNPRLLFFFHLLELRLRASASSGPVADFEDAFGEPKDADLSPGMSLGTWVRPTSADRRSPDEALGFVYGVCHYGVVKSVSIWRMSKLKPSRSLVDYGRIGNFY